LFAERLQIYQVILFPVFEFIIKESYYCCFIGFVWKVKSKATRMDCKSPSTLFTVFNVAATAMVVSAVVGIHLIGAIVVIRSIR
jgi:hypothetical protein